MFQRFSNIYVNVKIHIDWIQLNIEYSFLQLTIKIFIKCLLKLQTLNELLLLFKQFQFLLDHNIVYCNSKAYLI